MLERAGDFVKPFFKFAINIIDMKSNLILITVLFLAFPVFSHCQSNIPTKTFTVKELMMMLDSLPSEKIPDCMREHGYTFEKKGDVYSPYVSGPVKDAYCLIYSKDKKHFFIKFYEGKKYLINYFLRTEDDLDNLVSEIVPAGFTLVGQKDSMKFYDLKNKYGITTTRLTEHKVFSIADLPFAEKNKLMNF